MLPNRLKELRTNAKMSQKELAKKLFMSQQAVAKWETGAATPNPETLVKIAEIFGVTVDLLLSDTPISIFGDTSGSGFATPKETENNNVLEYRPTGTVPILGRIPAGPPDRRSGADPAAAHGGQRPNSGLQDQRRRGHPQAVPPAGRYGHPHAGESQV